MVPTPLPKITDNPLQYLIVNVLWPYKTQSMKQAWPQYQVRLPKTKQESSDGKMRQFYDLVKYFTLLLELARQM